jgi:hypothetical protein
MSKSWDKYFKSDIILQKKKTKNNSNEILSNKIYDSYLKDSEIYEQQYDSIKKFNKILKKHRKDEFEKMLNDTVGTEWLYKK